MRRPSREFRVSSAPPVVRGSTGAARSLDLLSRSVIVTAMDHSPARSLRVPPRPFRSRSPLRAAAVLLALLSVPAFAAAVRGGEWRVSPIRLDLGRDAKTGVLTVINEGDEKLQFQMSAREWTQDAEGKDAYEDSGDLVYYPKIMAVDGKSERIVRAGLRVPAAGKEKAYRLFIEEIPAPRKSSGASVAIAVRFGVPVFVKPIKEEPKAEIAAVAMDNGTVSARVRNAGNVHFIIRAVSVTGKSGRGDAVFSKTVDGWYLLPGVSRTYAAAVPAEVCPDVASVDVEVRTDRSTVAGRLNVDRSMCPR